MRSQVFFKLLFKTCWSLKIWRLMGRNPLSKAQFQFQLTITFSVTCWNDQLMGDIAQSPPAPASVQGKRTSDFSEVLEITFSLSLLYSASNSSARMSICATHYQSGSIDKCHCFLSPLSPWCFSPSLIIFLKQAGHRMHLSPSPCGVSPRSQVLPLWGEGGMGEATAVLPVGGQ